MNLKQLEYIVEIAKANNISKAAEKLFLSQSALNQQLLNIEKELNKKLFIRKNKELELTEAGIIYINYAKKILELKEEAYDKIKKLDNKKLTLNVGLTKERGNQMLVELYPIFHKKYSNIIISAIEKSVKNQIFDIKNKKLDFGFLTINNELKLDIKYTHLADEEIVLAVPKNINYLISNIPYSEVDLSYFKDRDFIVINKDSTLRDIQNKLFKDYNIEPKIIFETESNKISYNLVCANLGISLIPKSYAIESDNIFFYTLKEHPTWKIIAAYNKDLLEEEKYFIELAKNYWNKIING